MCTYLTEKVDVAGSGKGPAGWFTLSEASVYFDHPVHFGAGHALNSLDHFEYEKAMAVSAVEHPRGAAGAQLAKRIAMRTRQIAYVDVIANARAVRRRIVEAENFELRT